MKSFRISPPRATRLSPRNFLLTFIIFSVTAWLIFYLAPSRGWRKPPGREWHPAVYNPPPSLNPPWWTFGFGRRRKTDEGKPPPRVQVQPDPALEPECRKLPGAEDVLVVVKTGATESRKKLPNHLKTTLKCIPHFTVFGDLEETVAGQAVHDALDETTNAIKFSDPEFELYREQLEAQRRGRKDFSHFLESTETRGYAEDVALQKEEKRALTLDRWKFLPILEKSLERRGKAKWYVFIEADTGLVWSNLLQWLKMLDDKKTWYIGGEMFRGNDVFAHSGSGFILSNKAVRQAVKYLQKQHKRIDGLVMQEDRGDAIVGKVLSEVEIGVTRSWPMMQDETPSSIEYSRSHWCHPAVSYHRMERHDIKQLWDFEQRWISEKPDNTPILHRDVFNALVAPSISRNPVIKGWDNLSADKVLTPPEHPSKTGPDGRHTPTPAFTRPVTPKQSLAAKASVAHASTDACVEYCEAESSCLQWSYRGDGTCSVNYVVRLGYRQTDEVEERDIEGEGHDFIEIGRRKRKRKKVETVTSGWMAERVDAWRRRMEPCETKWITSQKTDDDSDDDGYQLEEERGMR